VVVPTGKLKPGVTSVPTATVALPVEGVKALTRATTESTPQLSVAVGTVQVVVWEQVGVVEVLVNRVWLDGQAASVGAVPSVIVTLKEQEAVLPAASLTR
jgi:hypothetical protein